MQKRIVEFIASMFVASALFPFYAPVQAAEFTADWFNTRQSVTSQGKIYVKDDMICIEVLEGSELGIIIADQEKRHSIVMLPNEKIYIEVPKNLSILEPDKDMIMGAEKKRMGTERVNGRSCDKYQYFEKDTATITQWIAKDLNCPVKIIYHGEGGNTAEVKNIKPGPVDQAVFHVRPGYTQKEVANIGKLKKVPPVEKGDDKASKSSEETTGKELGISNIVFCSKNPKGHMAYEEQPEATYKLGKTVWIYMNLNGLSHNPNPDGTKEVWIKMHLRVKSPNGDILLDQDLYNEHKNFRKKFDLDKMFSRVNLNTVSGMAEGRYTVELDLKDNLAGIQASASSIFSLKK